MADEQQAMPGLPVDAAQQEQEVQQALLEAAMLFADEATQRAQDWHLRWPDPSAAPKVAAISVTMRATLEQLRRALGRPEGPASPEVAEALNALLGTSDAPGPLERVQALITDAAADRSLDNQRLLSDLDTLAIRLNGLRAQWQEYLSLSAPRQSTSVQPITEPLPRLPPLPPNPHRRSANQENTLTALLAGLEAETAGAAARQGESLWHGLTGTLKVTLALLGVLLLVVFLAYQAAVRLPLMATRPTPNPALAPTAARGPTAAPPTSTPPTQATGTATPQPTASPTAPPTATPPPTTGSAQLSVNPPTLTIPCPGTGAASLQLINTGSQPLDWQATVSGAAGEVLLNGAASEQGHLNPGDETTISVTAQTQSVQGTINITYTGAPGPIMVAYSVGC